MAESQQIVSKRGEELTYVCCIEHGRLEQQTLTMIGSLREFGGALGQGRVICVIGRRGASLSRRTLHELKRLDVELVHARRSDNPANWFNYANKIAAVATAERLADTAVISWLDSDILFADEPRGLVLAPGEDFAARCEHLPPAVTAGDPTHVPYWQALCRLFGVDFADVPWIDRDDGRPTQKMYFNSGLFSWRRGSGFAAAYSAAFRKLLASRLAQRDGSFFTADQVILTPVVLKNSLRWRHLEMHDHLMIFQGFIEGPGAAPSMARANAIHYSKSLDAPFRERFLARLAVERPVLHAWLEGVQSGASSQSPIADRLYARALRGWRGAQWRLYAKFVRRCDDGQLSLTPE